MSVGMPWASKGHSVVAASGTPVHPNGPAQPVEAPSVETRGDAGRDRLAQTALQAANAYARAPCDRMAKTAFVVAASTYLRAQDAASPPKDARVHDAIKAAFEAGHIGSNEFPPDLMIAGRFAAGPPGRAACVNSAGLGP